MTEPFADTLLTQLSEHVARQMGLHFARQRWPDLERGVRSAAVEFGFEDARLFGQWLVSTPLARQQIELLASHLTVGETYFFRENRVLVALQEHILPELIQSRRGAGRPLRIWSAGCCTGEEPYTIAILLSQLLANPPDPPVSILATDINPHFLRKAAAGVYSEWSFRDTPATIRERYFKRTAEARFEVLPHLRSQVTFSLLNLAQDTYPSLQNNTNAMDIIFCRNVLMYFAPEWSKKVIHNLQHSLVEGGWLVVSSTEASHVLFAEFETVNFPQVILYRKDSRRPRAAPPASLEARPVPTALASGVFQPEEVTAPAAHIQEPFRPPAKPQLVPAQPDPYLAAAALFGQGHYGQAEAAAHGLLRAHPDEGRAMTLLARIYANQGQLTEALAWCQQAIAVDRLSPASHYLHATIEQERGQLAAAAQSLKRALYLDPDFVLAHYALGNLAQRQGKRDEADKYFANTLSLLGAYPRDALLPESDGLTAGRLLEIVRATASPERQA